jgi:hypothetical protein
MTLNSPARSTESCRAEQDLNILGAPPKVTEVAEKETFLRSLLLEDADLVSDRHKRLDKKSVWRNAMRLFPTGWALKVRV